MKDHHIHPVIRQFVRTQTTVNVDRYSDVGGIGAVYFGERVIFTDRVAMKFYPVDPAGAAHNEPYLLKSLTNENILPIYHAEIISNQFSYYITPEISGGDLKDYLEKNVIDTDTALNIISGILNGLSAIHNKRLVHRDLKTLNILIDAKTNLPYIADFGSIKELPTGMASTTASSFTHLYRSKEMIEKNEHYFESDIYQVGVIMFQVLGGSFPLDNPLDWLDTASLVRFQNCSTEQERFDCWAGCIDRKILKNQLLNFSTLPPYIRIALIKIIKKATHIDYTKRFKTCSEFAAAIFDVRKKLKNWWMDGANINCESKKKKRKYVVFDYATSPRLSISINNGPLRGKNVGASLSNILSFIENE